MMILKCGDPWSIETTQAVALVRKQCKQMLAELHKDQLLPSLQLFIQAMALGGVDEAEVDDGIGLVPIPEAAIKTIGHLANYAMTALMVEMAKEAKAQTN